MGLSSFANPIISPRMAISELMFENEDKWVIEISYEYFSRESYSDSIGLSTSADTVFISTEKFIGERGVVVLRQDSLESVFRVNKQGDIVSLLNMPYSHYDLWPPLIFGNYPDAVIPSPREGQSISLIDYGIYVKDKSPTIGQINDKDGIFGILQGKVFDKNKYLVPNFTFWFNNTVTTSEFGEFTANVHARPYSLQIIMYKKNDGTYSNMNIQPISYVMEPDSVVYRDIYLIDDLESSIGEVIFDNLFKVYPNPLNKSRILHYEINLPVKSSSCKIEVVAVNGKILLSKNILETKGIIQLPETDENVIVVFCLDNHKLFSKKNSYGI